MATRTLKFLIWFSALAILLACVPTMGTPIIPTTDPNQVNLFIEQTANAAVSQTAAAMPTATHTETPTPTEEDTSTPSPTYTSTVIFRLSSPTNLVSLTPTVLSQSGDSSMNLACIVFSVDPPNGTVLAPRTGFDAVWHLKNIGKKTWSRDDVDYVYKSGAKIHKVASYDLISNVKPGATTDIIVNMVAPKNPGVYTTKWMLSVGAKNFCDMPLTIEVK